MADHHDGKTRKIGFGDANESFEVIHEMFEIDDSCSFAVRTAVAEVVGHVRDNRMFGELGSDVPIASAMFGVSVGDHDNTKRSDFFRRPLLPVVDLSFAPGEGPLGYHWRNATRRLVGGLPEPMKGP